MGRWDPKTESFYLPRDRTKLISHNEIIFLAQKCNVNFVFVGDKSACMPYDPDEQVPLKELIKRMSTYVVKYGSKIDSHTGESLILNLLKAHLRTEAETTDSSHVPTSKRAKLLITRCTNALHKYVFPTPTVPEPAHITY